MKPHSQWLVTLNIKIALKMDFHLHKSQQLVLPSLTICKTPPRATVLDKQEVRQLLQIKTHHPSADSTKREDANMAHQVKRTEFALFRILKYVINSLQMVPRVAGDVPSRTANSSTQNYANFR